MATQGYIRKSMSNVANDKAWNNSTIKNLAVAVVIQAKKDYECGLLTADALHQFCINNWVWDVLDVEGESIERGIKNDH